MARRTLTAVLLILFPGILLFPQSHLPANVESALDEAVNLSMELTPYPSDEVARLARLVPRADPDRALALLESLTERWFEALRWPETPSSSMTASGSELIRVFVDLDLDAALEAFWEGQEGLPGVHRQWFFENVRPTLLQSIARHRPAWIRDVLREGPEQLPHIAASRAVDAALQRNDPELANEIIDLVTEYTSLRNGPKTVDALAAFVSGLPTSLAVRIAESFCLLADQMESLPEKPERRVTLRTRVGKADLSETEFRLLIVLYNQRRLLADPEKLRELPPRFLELSDSISTLAAQLGGWEALNSYSYSYSARRNADGSVSSMGGGSVISCGAKRPTFFPPHVEPDPFSVLSEILGQASSPETFKEGLKALYGFRDPANRDFILGETRQFVVSIPDPLERAAYADNWLQFGSGTLTFEEAAFWTTQGRSADALDPSGGRADRWLVQIADRLARQDFASTYRWVLDETEPDLVRLRALIAILES